MSENASYVVCGSKSWNRDLFDAELSKLSGEWHFLDSKESLTLEFLESIRPRYVFFLHWSWIVPEKIVQEFECVNFHMTDLPYGRGGSPLQNLILRGHTETKLTAHRMVKELDAGPVYGKEPMELSGSADLAKTTYEKIVLLYPDTAWAMQAKAKLAPKAPAPAKK